MMTIKSERQAKLEGIEPVYTVAEVTVLLPWSYDSVRRYFKDLPGVLVKHQSRRYKRAYRTYMIPQSVFQREWQKMATFNPTDVRQGGAR